MAKNLVIVESPAKAKTITKFLGKEYTILASMGHIRDLPKKELGFDTETFEPKYEVTPDKKKTITNLKKQIEKDTVIYLASDEDREGEAIAWHLVPALKVEKHPIKRIVFHEITKGAILHALENPRDIDQHLVDAQQARRLLDRVVGYELSPLLWKKIKFGLSAGRVQSVAVRIIVDREREIRAFKPEEFWKIKADHKTPEFQSLLAKVSGKVKKVKNETEAKGIEESIQKGSFVVSDIQEKTGKRKPPAPFTTSTLQQEAARKMGFSVKQTMMVAQQLYEGNVADIPGHSGGLITYMRTDSVNLSDVALKQAKEVVEKEFGADYALKTPRKYSTKSKGAQEAHEAIRPVNLALKPSDLSKYLDAQQLKLYEIIWKRTLATQMAEAEVANTTYKIEAGENKELEFEAKGQRIVFPGFMAAYTEGSDNPEEELSTKDKILPSVEVGQDLGLKELHLEQCFTKPPARYTEASLVKKLESEGIGRPSTYAPTISTIQTREYVEKTEDKKLKPTDMGEVVNDFLVNHFSDIVDLGFTAKMEEEFDEIAEGKKEWTNMLKNFYGPFHNLVEEKGGSVTREEVSKARVLGKDPKTGKEVSVRVGRFGPMVQIGTKDDEEKPQFASLTKEMNLNEVSLEDVLPLFNLPRTLGKDEDEEEVIVNRGRFGPYVKIGKTFYSIKEDDPMTISLEKALEIVKAEKERKAKALIHDFSDHDIQVLDGRYGPYIKAGKKNVKIPKGIDVDSLTLEECQKIITEAPEKKSFQKKK